MQQLKHTEVLPLSLDAALLTSAGQALSQDFISAAAVSTALCCRFCLP
jgi:hypothetical protein